MKIGDTAMCRMASCKQTKQSRMKQLAAAKQRNERRRSLLRRGQPPRALRSMRNTASRHGMQARPILTSVARALRKS